MKNYIIIVAAGIGCRLGSNTPKQFLLLDGMPVVMHTLMAYYRSMIKPDIILVLNKDHLKLWEGLCSDFDFDIPYHLVLGGAQRYHSVKNGLNSIKTDGIVGVHDGVRPLVTEDIITRTFQGAKEKGNAIPAVPAINPIRQLGKSSSQALDRDTLCAVQNPQVFDVRLLKKAYELPYERTFFDDATIVEKSGTAIHLIEGNKKDIKITYPHDICIAEALMPHPTCKKESDTNSIKVKDLYNSQLKQI